MQHQTCSALDTHGYMRMCVGTQPSLKRSTDVIHAHVRLDQHGKQGYDGPGASSSRMTSLFRVLKQPTMTKPWYNTNGR